MIYYLIGNVEKSQYYHERYTNFLVESESSGKFIRFIHRILKDVKLILKKIQKNY